MTIWICRWRMNTLVTSQYQPRLSSIAKIYSRRISQSDWNIEIKLNYNDIIYCTYYFRKEASILPEFQIYITISFYMFNRHRSSLRRKHSSSSGTTLWFNLRKIESFGIFNVIHVMNVYCVLTKKTLLNILFSFLIMLALL